MVNEIMKPTSKDLNSIDQPLWFNGPDGKKYLTEEGVTQAWEKMFRKKTVEEIHVKIKKIDDKIPIDKKEQAKILPDEKGFPFPDIRHSELSARIRKLAGLTPKEIKALAYFLNSLTNPPDIPPSTPPAVAPDLK